MSCNIRTVISIYDEMEVSDTDSTPNSKCRQNVEVVISMDALYFYLTNMQFSGKINQIVIYSKTTLDFVSILLNKNKSCKKEVIFLLNQNILKEFRVKTE